MADSVARHCWVEEVGPGRWMASCECGWVSGGLLLPDPDAAYHVAHLHDAVAHPERIDWPAEIEKIERRAHG